MVTASSTTPQSWHPFLHSTAISYLAPPPQSTSSSSTDAPTATVTTKKSLHDYYWHRELLEKWHGIIDSTGPNSGGADDAGLQKSETGGVRDINYGSYILMATFIAENLCHRLSLDIAFPDGFDGEHDDNNQCDSNGNSATSCGRGRLRKVGIAIPEGPFLPLYVLAVHSLNVAVGENWLFLKDDNHPNGKAQADEAESTIDTAILSHQRCGGAVLIPMETDEAPERLKHILSDSSPDLILVAPGKDWESMDHSVQNVNGDKIQQPTASSIQLVDYTQVMEEALSSLHTCAKQLNNGNDSVSSTSKLVDQLWPPEEGTEVMDSLRYSHAISGCFDVARLVTMGLVRLLSSTPPDASPPKAHNSLPQPTSTPNQHAITSHIVYTSGTTGKPKGCVSSLSSLQHYLRAKNLAHGIDTESRVLLASAVTFDPCFSDVLATCAANGTLCLVPRDRLYGHDDGNDNSIDRSDDGYGGLTKVLNQLSVTHILCTPTLWATVEGGPNDVPSLKVVALGGEPIPKALVRKWARCKRKDGSCIREYPRLSSTYGVTEACVYQTYGEVVLSEDGVGSGSSNGSGQNVGMPLLGSNIHICIPYPEEDDRKATGQDNVITLQFVEQDVNSSEPTIGEVVLSGAQLDGMSSYLNLPELTSRVFVQCCGDEKDLGNQYFYRTGDLGYIDPKAGNLHILGRIKGDGMVKINGIRVELREIENSVIDDDDVSVNDCEEGRLVVDCMAAMDVSSSFASSKGDDTEQQQHKQLIAYCLLSAASLSQLGLSSDQLRNGLIVPPGPLLYVLRTRSARRVRKGCVPSAFVLIDRFPLSPTGKRDRSALPPLAECSIMGGGMMDEKTSLWDAGGRIGAAVADRICECLNLQPCQRQLVTLDANFFVLGGDSLAATRVVRALYARYHGIMDSRNLGGATGTLGGPFAAKHLLQSRTLGDYVEFLASELDDSSPAFETDENYSNSHNAHVTEIDNPSVSVDRPDSNSNDKQSTADPLYDSLVESITLGYTAIASSLLDLGVDPNKNLQTNNRGRMGKITDRNQRRALFKSNPLHLACLRGDPYLVKKLLDKGCKANSPDASGSFPIHLACSRLEDKADDDDCEDRNRLDCVRLLLGSGTPISIKDGNKQTILHSAARSGHRELLTYIMYEWKLACETTGMKFKSHSNLPGRIYDWHDRWFRTPVHWAVLNHRTSALRILLDGGCSACPPKPKSGVSNRSTNVIIESPLEMCQRLGIGDEDEICCLLRHAEY